MSIYTGVYMSLHSNAAYSTARTILQINNAATRTIELLEAWVTFDSTTSTQIEVRLKRVSTAGTGSAASEVALRANSVAAAAAVTQNHTAEGTIGDGLTRMFVNYLNGFRYLPVPEARITIAPSGRLAMDFPTAPGASVNISAGIVWGEIG